MNDNDIKEYIKRVGTKGAGIFRAIMSLRPAIDVYINQEEGFMLLKDDVERHMELFQKIYESLIVNGQVSQADCIELQYLHGRLSKIGSKLARYEQLSEEVERALNENVK